jgi:hypothetical protein
MRSDMVPGSIFPDYELPDHTTKRRKLSELQGQDPMVLVLTAEVLAGIPFRFLRFGIRSRTSGLRQQVC